MRIKSRAGNFNMTIDEVAAENGELVLTGKMGVWQAKTYVSIQELEETLASLKIQGNVIDFLALFGFRYLRGLLERQAGAAAPAPGTLVAAPAGAPRAARAKDPTT
jgi:hypothetical protein